MVSSGTLPETGHDLARHLQGVADRAAAYASGFGSQNWAAIAGLWHDLGKYRPAFQRKLDAADGAQAHLEGAAHRVTHSHAGAIQARKKYPGAAGDVLATLIAGHHAGLPDLQSADGGAGSLSSRLASDYAATEYAEAIAQSIPAEILDPRIAGLSPCPGGADGFALWIRLLFSCLVDADFLDTEGYADPVRHAQRVPGPPISDMLASFHDYMRAVAARSRSGSAAETLNHWRGEVLRRCVEVAQDSTLGSGFYRLSVPTGGGKTLASLGFALEHAVRLGKSRVVYAIPFTSIIEQTATVFREVFKRFGPDAVLEHHSNLDMDASCETSHGRLAAENWDASLIVTTNVQLFESLHAARTSRCRKLHRLVDAVVVLDEAQMLPRDFLAPILRSLKLLVHHYGVSVVLCTATQPALQSRFAPVTSKRLLDGVDEAIDIMHDQDALFSALRRVVVDFPGPKAPPTPWDQLASELREHEVVLAIVNTRRQARDLCRLLDDPSAVHLSALMCAAHRSVCISRIRGRLRGRREGSDADPLRVISTSLVEAGVDLDFPVVFRALAGLDSIAQAAGRCNREGNLPEPGLVRVFVPPDGPPAGQARQGAQVTSEMLASGMLDEPLAPKTFAQYFDRYYAMDADGILDRHKVLELQTPQRAALRSAAEAFRLIDDSSEPVVVPYAIDGDDSPVHGWLAALSNNPNIGTLRARLQRYTVSVPRRVLDLMIAQGDVVERAGLWLAHESRYDPTFGLLLPDDHGAPAGLFV